MARNCGCDQLEGCDGNRQQSESVLRVAAYFNPVSQTWVARHKKISHRRLDHARQQENVYGYGSELGEAIRQLVQQVPAAPVVCRVLARRSPATA